MTMSDDSLCENMEAPDAPDSHPELVEPEVVDGDAPREDAPPPVRARRWRPPLLLFIATCLSTVLAGGGAHWVDGWWVAYDLHDGLIYALSLMTILACHEAGHFFQAHRYGVYASFPYFLPMPFLPLGTLGAVIGMDARVGDRKALFDIGITGPLAGLVPTIAFCIIGLRLSTPSTGLPDPGGHVLGSSILFSHLVQTTLGPLAPDWSIDLHPMAMAGWVGLLVTALNLLPIGQLDGGHILYGLLRKKAHFVATFLLAAALVAVVLFGFWWWWLMLFLLILMGPKHPPTAGDDVPLGMGRIVLGWLTLAFILIGFTPKPFIM